MKTVLSTLAMFMCLLACCIFVFGIAFAFAPVPVSQSVYEVML